MLKLSRTPGLRALSALVVATLALCTAPSAWALYKVVGPDGKVTYTDRAPVETGTQRLRQDGATPGTVPLPFDVQQAVRKYPVVLYVSKVCPACDQGRNFLKARGVPFTEKTTATATDLKALEQLEGTTQVPVLKVGRQRLLGFNSAEWGSTLDDATYPKNSKLPKDYAWAPAVPIAPPAATAPTAAAGTEDAAERPAAPPQPPVAPPPGIRF